MKTTFTTIMQNQPGIPGARQAVRAHRGGVLLMVARRASRAARSWSR
jgi:hypothetical protein